MSDETTNKPHESGSLRGEYRFDYAKAKPNRFASRFQESSVAVVLDPDVASFFGSSESVNRLLRSVMAALKDGKEPAPSANRT